MSSPGRDRASHPDPPDKNIARKKERLDSTIIKLKGKVCGFSDEENQEKIAKASQQECSTSSDNVSSNKEKDHPFRILPKHEILNARYCMWENSSVVCWLDASMALLAHNQTLRYQTNLKGSAQIFKIIKYYNEAICTFNDENSQIDFEVRVNKAKLYLKAAQESSLKYLQPIVKYKEGEPDSAFCSMYNLICEDKKVRKYFDATIRWSLYCEECGKSRVTKQTKPIITLSKVVAFQPSLPTTICECSECKAPEQRRQVTFKSLPQCLIFHFERGAGKGELQPLDFTLCGRDYKLTGVMTLEKAQETTMNHFVSFIREPNSDSWLECNDLLSDPQKFTKVPSGYIVLEDVCLIMFEAFDDLGTIEVKVSQEKSKETLNLEDEEQDDANIPFIDLSQDAEESGCEPEEKRAHDLLLEKGHLHEESSTQSDSHELDFLQSLYNKDNSKPIENWDVNEEPQKNQSVADCSQAKEILKQFKTNPKSSVSEKTVIHTDDRDTFKATILPLCSEQLQSTDIGRNISLQDTLSPRYTEIIMKLAKQSDDMEKNIVSDSIQTSQDPKVQNENTSENDINMSKPSVLSSIIKIKDYKSLSEEIACEVDEICSFSNNSTKNNDFTENNLNPVNASPIEIKTLSFDNIPSKDQLSEINMKETENQFSTSMPDLHQILSVQNSASTSGNLKVPKKITSKLKRIKSSKVQVTSLNAEAEIQKEKCENVKLVESIGISKNRVLKNKIAEIVIADSSQCVSKQVELENVGLFQRPPVPIEVEVKIKEISSVKENSFFHNKQNHKVSEAESEVEIDVESIKENILKQHRSSPVILEKPNQQSKEVNSVEQKHFMQNVDKNESKEDVYESNFEVMSSTSENDNTVVKSSNSSVSQMNKNEIPNVSAISSVQSIDKLEQPNQQCSVQEMTSGNKNSPIEVFDKDVLKVGNNNSSINSISKLPIESENKISFLSSNCGNASEKLNKKVITSVKEPSIITKEVIIKLVKLTPQKISLHTSPNMESEIKLTEVVSLGKVFENGEQFLEKMGLNSNRADLLTNKFEKYSIFNSEDPLIQKNCEENILHDDGNMKNKSTIATKKEESTLEPKRNIKNRKYKKNSMDIMLPESAQKELKKKRLKDQRNKVKLSTSVTNHGKIEPLKDQSKKESVSTIKNNDRSLEIHSAAVIRKSCRKRSNSLTSWKDSFEMDINKKRKIASGVKKERQTIKENKTFQKELHEEVATNTCRSTRNRKQVPESPNFKSLTERIEQSKVSPSELKDTKNSKSTVVTIKGKRQAIRENKIASSHINAGKESCEENASRNRKKVTEKPNLKSIMELLEQSETSARDCENVTVMRTATERISSNLATSFSCSSGSETELLKPHMQSLHKVPQNSSNEEKCLSVTKRRKSKGCIHADKKESDDLNSVLQSDKDEDNKVRRARKTVRKSENISKEINKESQVSSPSKGTSLGSKELIEAELHHISPYKDIENTYEDEIPLSPLNRKSHRQYTKKQLKAVQISRDQSTSESEPYEIYLEAVSKRSRDRRNLTKEENFSKEMYSPKRKVSEVNNLPFQQEGKTCIDKQYKGKILETAKILESNDSVLSQEYSNLSKAEMPPTSQEIAETDIGILEKPHVKLKRYKRGSQELSKNFPEDILEVNAETPLIGTPCLNAGSTKVGRKRKFAIDSDIFECNSSNMFQKVFNRKLDSSTAKKPHTPPKKKSLCDAKELTPKHKQNGPKCKQLFPLPSSFPSDRKVIDYTANDNSKEVDLSFLDSTVEQFLTLTTLYFRFDVKQKC